MEAILNDKEFLEILIKNFPEDEKTHLKTEYNKLTNKDVRFLIFVKN